MNQKAENVPERPSRLGERLFSEHRVVTLFGEINSELAEGVAQRLLLLGLGDARPITLFLHSPGGHVESGDSLFDVIRFLEPRVRIIGSGWVASAGALIYAAIPRERRFSLPNTRFLLHEPRGGAQGQASDIAIEVEQIVRMRERLTKIFAEATGKSVEAVTADTKRNLWMSANEALEYGLVGKIVTRADEVFGSDEGEAK